MSYFMGENMQLRSNTASNLSEGCDNKLDAFPDIGRPGPFNWPSVVCSSIISLYLFWALAVVCDDYLVPSIELFCVKIHMPLDIGGATLLAASTSAPELFVSLIGTFITESDLGLAAIVGSSVFNTLGVIGLCGIISKTPFAMDCWPVTRDILWYIVSVCLLAFIMRDHQIVLWEAIMLLVAYAINLICLLLDRRLQKLVRKKTTEEMEDKDEESEAEEDNAKTIKENLCGYPKESNCCLKIFWILGWPFRFLFCLTIPTLKCCYLGTMFMATVWTAILCYLVSWSLAVFGFNFRIPESVMGVTILAVGTSVPEAVSSYIVTRKGHGVMAITNVVSSNSFDILICLGVPWFIMILKEGKPLKVVTENMLFATISLLVTAIGLELLFIISRFRCGRTVGWICMISFIIYVAGASTMFIINCL